MSLNEEEYILVLGIFLKRNSGNLIKRQAYIIMVKPESSEFILF